ncbi:Uncharacterized membrane protein HdeD, DUF308 family [Paramicrobacterium humi]|uniref:Uncharacterized membrane protein HdeD, DUF308 family n=1 Tax=Paramicrobacterium humi TaxID=640635 RepID=A0A1H4LME2_9MICO|nr:hypothetical protein [Microbacterium humi]SEB71824.1 Uncharacterized membrane protein HdeD, DUF308 family [Microbacterium humi]
MVTPADVPRGTTASATAPHTRLWALQLSRAVIFALAAVYITFSADHSAHLGLVVFGVTAVVAGIVVGSLAFPLIADGPTRRLVVAQSAITLAAGVVALLLRDSGLGSLLLTVAIWAGITGLLELYTGYRLGRRAPLSKDFLIVGAFTALLAVVFVLLPPDFVQTGGGEQGAPATLTSSVMAVGVFGAYAAIVAVYLAIAGLSLKWQRTDAATDVQEESA